MANPRRVLRAAESWRRCGLTSHVGQRAGGVWAICAARPRPTGSRWLIHTVRGVGVMFAGDPAVIGAWRWPWCAASQTAGDAGADAADQYGVVA